MDEVEVVELDVEVEVVDEEDEVVDEDELDELDDEPPRMGVKIPPRRPPSVDV